MISSVQTVSLAGGMMDYHRDPGSGEDGLDGLVSTLLLTGI
jgi:hypothetical protein